MVVEERGGEMMLVEYGSKRRTEEDTACHNGQKLLKKCWIIPERATDWTSVGRSHPFYNIISKSLEVNELGSRN